MTLTSKTFLRPAAVEPWHFLDSATKITMFQDTKFKMERANASNNLIKSLTSFQGLHQPVWLSHAYKELLLVNSLPRQRQNRNSQPKITAKLNSSKFSLYISLKEVCRKVPFITWCFRPWWVSVCQEMSSVFKATLDCCTIIRLYYFIYAPGYLWWGKSETSSTFPFRKSLSFYKVM